MLRHHITIAWRSFTRSKINSFINMGGLSVGMSAALLIGLWMVQEASFNKVHPNYEKIVQVMQHQNFNGDIHTDKAVPMPLASALRSAYPADFRYIVLSSWNNPRVLKNGDNSFSRKGSFMEPDAPAMLGLHMLKGTSSGLSDPSAILLSASTAKILFGSPDIIGQRIILDTIALTVKGVYEDLPTSSSFNQLEFIAPWALYSSLAENRDASSDWNQNAYQLFAQVAAKTEVQALSDKIKNIKAQAPGVDVGALHPVVFLQPMSRWHLYAAFKNGVNTGGAITYVRLFGIIGIFVLLLACINFMNLSTAKSEKRAKEVGVRKAIGSLRSQLVAQFYTESAMVVFTAFALSLLIVQLALPFFNAIAGKEMRIPFEHPLFWIAGIGFSFITAVVAGSYPAFYLSAFRAVAVLKGVVKPGTGAISPRKALVVVQCTVSVVLAIGTVVVYRQVQFARNRPAGYDNSGLIIMRPYSEDYHIHFNALRNDLLQSGVVHAVAESGNSIIKGSRTVGGLEWKNKPAGFQDEFNSCAVTADYGKTVGWELVAGRDFSKELATDSAAIILNEAAVKYMGLSGHPLNEIIRWTKNYTVIGVVKDVVMSSPYETVKPAFYYPMSDAGYLNIRIRKGAPMATAIDKIATICKSYSPAAPFDYTFADEAYAEKFADETRIGQLELVLATLAIFISCLGLFGLANFVAEQRTKEIGVRKVLGASIVDLWNLQSREFLTPVIIALLIALPLAYYGMHTWLNNYQYRTALNGWMFAGVAMSAILVTLLTVSYHAIKTAMLNPVKSLRSE